MDRDKNILNSINEFVYKDDDSKLKEKILNNISNIISFDDNISNNNKLLSQTTNSKVRKQNQINKALIDNIQKKPKKKVVKNFDDTDEGDDILAKKNEGKNLKRQVRTIRNVFFQLINKDLISLELDFTPSEAFLDLLNRFNLKLDNETSLWICHVDNYEKILEAIKSHNMSKEKISVFPISDLVFSIRNSTDFDSISFELDTELKYIYNKKIFTIDYKNDNQKKIEELPETTIKNLYPFQVDGIKYALSKHARLLIADEMGYCTFNIELVKLSRL